MVRKGQFLMIYSTVNHQRGGWVQIRAIFDDLQYCKSSELGGWALKSQKHDDVILEWSFIIMIYFFHLINSSDMLKVRK